MKSSNKILLGALVLILAGVGVWYSRAQKNPVAKSEATKVRIAYLPIANALPLYLAVEKGFFKDAGLEVEPIRFETQNQIIDSLIAGNADFGSPSTAMGVVALSQSKNPGTLKIFALNGGHAPDNIDNLLLVKNDSNIQSVKDLKGKKLGSLPGIQNRTIAQHILATEGLEMGKDVEVVDIALPLQLQALSSNQIDAVLTLEPIGSTGKKQKIAKDLVVGPMLKYIVDPWYGGGGVVSVKFQQSSPGTTAKVLAVFDRAIKEINKDPAAARQYLQKYTGLTEDISKDVPLPIWKMYTEFQQSDVDALQKFIDILPQYKVMDGRLDVQSIIYR